MVGNLFDSGRLPTVVGDFIFENEWQSFRTKKDRSLELTSAGREVDKNKERVKIAVKVMDNFGLDTMTIVDVAAKKLPSRECQRPDRLSGVYDGWVDLEARR